MSMFADKTQECKVPVAPASERLSGNTQFKSRFADHRPAASAQLKLQELCDNSPQTKQLGTLQKIANNSAQTRQLRASHNHLPVQREGIAKPKATGAQIPIEVQTEEELALFTANIDRLRQQLAALTPAPDEVRNGEIEIAKAQAAAKPALANAQSSHILQDAFQNLGPESREYWLALENHTDMINALGKIVEKATAGVQGTGKPVNMKLFNIKIDAILENEDDLMVNVQQLMRLAGGNRDYLVLKTADNELPASFGVNCGSTIMDAFNESLDGMPGQAADPRTAAQKISDKVNETLMRRVVDACVARFRWPVGFDALVARDIIEAAINYKVGLNDNLSEMYSAMSIDAQNVIKEELASIYTYDRVMELLGPLIQQYAGAAYQLQPMDGEDAGTANAMLSKIWQELGFNNGDIQAALVANIDYTYSLTVSAEQLEAIAVAGGIVERTEPIHQDDDEVAAEPANVELFSQPATRSLPAQVAEVVRLKDGTGSNDNLYYKPETGMMGSKGGFFDAAQNATARTIYRNALVYRAIRYLSARMPKSNASRFNSKTEFQDISPYKLSHATAELLSINAKAEAFLLTRN